MASFSFDGSQNVTATQADNVQITADPQTFTGATDNGVDTTLTFGSATLTITGTTLAMGNLPNVFVTGGVFDYLGSVNTNGAGTGNVLSFGGDFNQATVNGGAELVTTASSKLELLGGLSLTDTTDVANAISVGGKGSFLIFGNGGGDTLGQTTTAFDSTSIVNANGGIGDDTITYGAQNIKASIFAGAGDGLDSITVVNSGATTIFGGLDSTDGADKITFDGVTGGAAGTSQIFGNGGDDTVTVGGGVGLDSTSATTVFGGVGNDSITATAAVDAKATISLLGNEGADTINVTGFGNTFITGGNQSGDQSLDSADSITFTGSGNALIFGNAGADSINANASTANDSNFSIYGGKDGDTITQTAAGAGKATVFISGGEGGDTISAVANGGGVTIYGGISSADSTDGADSISFNGAANNAGATNIFANAGNDTININTLGQDTANAVSLQAGSGKDSIVVAAQTNTSQALSLTGNADADTFAITKGTGQSITVTDFTTGSGNDSLSLKTGVAGTLAVAGGSFATLQASLDAAAAASGGAGKAGAVVFSGDTYVVVNGDGNATFSAAADQAIKLTGVTNVADLTVTTATVA